MNGITYIEDCRIGASNIFESLLCGQSWQQTQFSKAIFVGVVLIIIMLGALFLKRKFLK